MGPWIATNFAPNNLETTIRMHGQVQSQGNTRHMRFDAARHLAKISWYSMRYPGDVVWLGAEGATPNMRETWWKSRSAASWPSGTLWWQKHTRLCSRCSTLPSRAAVFQRAVAQGRRHRPADTGDNGGICDYGVCSL